MCDNRRKDSLVRQQLSRSRFNAQAADERLSPILLDLKHLLHFVAEMIDHLHADAAVLWATEGS